MPQKTYSAPAAASTLEVLEFMAANPGARGPSELAKRLGLTPNLTFRVLNVLQEKGYVKRNPAGQYELTSGLFSLGMKLHNNFDLRKQSRPFLEALAEESGESCQLQEFEGDIKKIWQSNMFGKSFHELVNEDLQGKLMRMPEDVRVKLRETLERISNEGTGGLICIIL